MFCRITALLALIPPLLSATEVPEGMLSGRIVGNASENNVILEMTFTNTSSEAICLYHWVSLADEVQEMLYGNAFLIRNSRGLEPQYVSARVSGSSGESNNRSYVAVPGGTLRARYNLAKLYDLKSDEYSVTFYVTSIECSAFNHAWPYLYSPDNLRGLVSEYGYDIEKDFYKGLEPNVKQHVKIHKMNLVHFVLTD